MHREAGEEVEEEKKNKVQVGGDHRSPSPIHIDPVSGIYIGDIAEEKEVKLAQVTRKLVRVVKLDNKEEEEEMGDRGRDRCLPVRWKGIDLVKQKGRQEWF